MALNPIQFTRQVTDEFRRYQLTAFPLADPRLADQARALLGTGAFDQSPLTKGPYVSLARGFAQGAALADLAERGAVHPTLPGIAEHPSLFAHQEKTLLAALGGSHVLVSTGTGSGKTESFLYPIIDRCLRMQDEGEAAGVAAVLVYPMNALASDQRDRLRSLLAGTGITYGMFVGSTPSNPAAANVRRLAEGEGRDVLREALARRRRNDLDPVPFEECASEAEIRERKPRILITNANQLELLLTRKQDADLFSEAPLSFIVLDEAHTYSGASGAEVACLVRRLRSFAGRTADEVTCIATSATIVDPEGGNDVAPEFLSRLCGVPQERVALVEEEYQDLDWPGARAIPAAPADPEAVLAQVLDALGRAGAEDDPDVTVDVDALEAAVGALTGTAPRLDRKAVAESLFDALFAMEPVRVLAEELRHPLDLATVTSALRARLGRTGEPPPGAAAELLSYLALGAFASRNDAPLLRPKLHVFVRGLEGAVMTFDGEPLDVCLHFSKLDALQTGEADRLPSAVFPVSVCKTCGQHYGTAFLRAYTTEGGAPMGGEATGESGFWLPAPDAETEGAGQVRFTDVLVSEGDDEDDANDQARRRTARLNERRTEAYVCVRCGSFHREAAAQCASPDCGRPGPMAKVFIVHDADAGFRCLGCGAQSRSPTGRRIEPIRPLRATTVADVHILAQEMISAVAAEDDAQRLLIFADNRQDAAFQAGWMGDHARRYRLRYLMLEDIRRLEHDGPVSVGDLHDSLTRRLTEDRDLARALAPEAFRSAGNEAYGKVVRRDLERFLRIQILRELATSFAQRDGLERWGQLRVNYHGLEADDKRVRALADDIDLEPAVLVDGLASLLDIWRRAAMLHDEDEPIFGRWYREGQEDIQRGFIPFGFTERPPTGVELERQDGVVDKFVRTVISSRGRTGPVDFIAKWGVEDPREAATACWELLRELDLVCPVTLKGSGDKVLPGSGGAHHVDDGFIGMTTQHERYRCSQCRRVHARPTPNDACTKMHCHGKVQRDDPPADDYNVSLLGRPFAMVTAAEHTAQVPAERRHEIEKQFKRDGGSINTLVATPTLELGVDIGALDLVLCRNVPPTAANYWQRVGRAGRRRRMAVIYVYCRNAVHDSYFFDDPTQLLGAPLRPPRFNLKNDVLVTKHVHATVISELLRIAAHDDSVRVRYEQALPQYVRDYVFEGGEQRFRPAPADVSALSALIDENKAVLLGAVNAVFAANWPAEASDEVAPARLAELVATTGRDLQGLVDRLHERLGWVLDTQARLSAEADQRVLNEDETRQLERCRAYIEGLRQNHVRTYTLSVLAGEGYLPGYGIYDGGITAFPGRRGGGMSFELSRPQAVAVREFVPGNKLYANGGSYRAGRFHFPVTGQRQRVDTYLAELESGYITTPGQSVPGYGSGAPVRIEALRISDVDLAYLSPIRDEENERFQLPVTVLGMAAKLRRGGSAYTSGATSIHHVLGQGLRLVNVGPADRVRAQNPGYPVCTVCGAARSPYASDRELQDFDGWHKKECGRAPDWIALTAEVVADVLRFQGLADQSEAANLGEALRIGAAQVLEMEPDDVQMLPVPCADSSFDLYVYDPMPGGSGLLAQMLDRWDEIVTVLQKVLGDCAGVCEKSCYRCMRTGRNVFWHRLLDRSVALEVIVRMSDKPTYQFDLPAQADETFGGGPQSTNDAEDRLVDVLERQGLAGFATGQQRIELPEPFKGTTPDVVWPDHMVALYLDGLSKDIHGSVARAQADELLRDALEDLGWRVITIAASHLDDPELLRAGLRRLARALKRTDAVERIRAASSTELVSPGPPRDATGLADGVSVLSGHDAAPGLHPVPLYNVRAAAGRFLENLEVEEEGWVLSPPPVDERLFAIHVEGASMEPGIPDGAIALFRAGPTGAGPGGSRSGKVLLIALQDGDSTSHVVKRYISEKRPDDDGGWEHATIILASDNPDYADHAVSAGDEVRVVAEFVRVLPDGGVTSSAPGSTHG